MTSIFSIPVIAEEKFTEVDKVTRGDDTSSFTIEIIDEKTDYDRLLSESDRLNDKRTYTPFPFIKAHQPYAILYSGSSEPSLKRIDTKEKLENLVKREISQYEGDVSKLSNTEFFILNKVIFTEDRETGTEPGEGSNHTGLNLADSDPTITITGETRNTTEIDKSEVFSFYVHEKDGWYTDSYEKPVIEEVEDWRYEWERISDLSSLDIRKGELIIVDIEGTFQLSEEKVSVDIVPVITIDDTTLSFPEFAWWNQSFKYKEEHTVTSNLTSSLTNALYLVDWTRTVNDSANCEDFRWINGSEDSSSPIYHENCNSTTTYSSWTWVNESLDSGTGNQTRYRYYDLNSSTEKNISDANIVFGAGIEFVYTCEGNVSNVVNTAKSGSAGGTAQYNTSDPMHNSFCDFSGNWHIDLDTSLPISGFVTNPWSFATWAKFYDGTGSETLLEYNNDQLDGGVRYAVYTSDWEIGAICGGSPAVGYAQTLPLNEWHHYAATTAGGATGEAIFYIDGQEVARGNANSCTTSESFINRFDLGQTQGGSDSNVAMDGTIFEVGKVWTADEIASLADTSNTKGLVEEFSDDIIFDTRNIWTNDTVSVFLNSSISSLDLSLPRIIPSLDLVYDLGSTTLRWLNIYTQNLDATGKVTANNISSDTIFENNNRFPQPTTCSGNNKIAVFNSDGTFTCQEDKIRPGILTKLCDVEPNEDCTITDMSSGYNVTVWAKGVYSGDNDPKNVTLYESNVSSDYNEVDLQQPNDRDSISLIHYMKTNSSDDISYKVNNSGGTLSQLKIMIQVIR